MSSIVHLDFEARSGVDITDVGSHRWSIDPKFEILCAAVKVHGDPRVYLWVNPLFACDAMPTTDNAEAERILASATIIYAHNAPNELANTWGALEQGKACPIKTLPPFTIWRCTAAMARKAGLPYSLDKLCEALHLEEGKDKRGKQLIKLSCIADEDTGEFVDPRSRPEEWRAFGQYCCQDTRAEEQCADKLKPFELSGMPLATFQFDLRMNQRGIPINVAAARNAQKIIDAEQAEVVQEFRTLTGLNPTQRAKFVGLLETEHGIKLLNTQAPTIEAEIVRLEEVMTGDLNATEAHQLLTLYQKVSYAAVKKVTKMLDCACPDGRVRGGHMYYGAGPGRWSGKLLQPQNFKKTPKWMRTKEDDITDSVYEAIVSGTTPFQLDQLYGPPLEVISGVIRQFIGLPGSELFDGDYSGIEARILAWRAGQLDVVQEWIDYDLHGGPGPYKHMAAYIYDIDVSEVDSDQREVGKRVVLGAGYQMGPDKFQESCKTLYQLDLPKDLCVRGIKAFREKCRKISSYWYQLDEQCKSAVRHPGTQSGPFRVRNIAGMQFLLFTLASGRAIAYPHPKIELVPFLRKNTSADTLDENWEPKEEEAEFRENVTYWGQIPGSTRWGRIKLYGGKLTENEVQGTAADFMAHGAINAEKLGMEPFMLVHDQGLALCRPGKTVKEFEAALGDLPAWAKGFPMKVEAKTAKYYKK